MKIIKRSTLIIMIMILTFTFSVSADKGATGYKIISEYKTPLYTIEISNLHSNYMGPEYGTKYHQNIVTKTVAGLATISNIHVWTESCRLGKAHMDIVYFDSKIPIIKGRICDDDQTALEKFENALNKYGNKAKEVLDDLGLVAAGAALLGVITVIIAWIIENLWWVPFFL